MEIFKKVILSLILVSSFVLANSVGTITALKGSATIVRDDSNIEATVGAKLNEKDTITTKAKSKIQIIFNDETIITIGQNSNFSIYEYLFEENKAPKAKFGLLTGAIRTITGKIGKIAPDKFSVETKTALIGIRGTDFTILAREDGGIRAYCTFGAISVSVNGKIVIVEQGFYVDVSADGKIGKLQKFTPQQLKKMRSDSFVVAESTKETDPTGLTETTVTDSSGDIDMVVSDITQRTTAGTQANALDAAEAAAIPDLRINDNLELPSVGQ